MKTPRDLEGRTVGLVPGSVNDLLWRAFAKAAGFDAGKVRTVGVDSRTYVQQFAAGQVDAANSALGSPENMRFARGGKPVGEFVYSDYLPMVGFGIVVSHKTLADRPEVVQRFVKATQKGWEYLLQSPREAVAEGAGIIKKYVEGAPDEALIRDASLQVMPRMMRSRGTEGKPAGWSNPEDWGGMIAMLQQYDQLPRAPSVDELMTNQFVE
jgi:NitT/TauT family transport system substrate-binding protein